MTGGRSLRIGAALVACAGVGLSAGYDAAAHIDRFYAAPPSRAYRALPAVPASSAWDWDETPAAVAYPVGSPAAAGPSERAFFDTGGFDTGGDVSEIDRAVEAAAATPVRVHRPRRADAPRLAEREIPVADPAEDQPPADPSVEDSELPPTS